MALINIVSISLASVVIWMAYFMNLDPSPWAL